MPFPIIAWPAPEEYWKLEENNQLGPAKNISSHVYGARPDYAGNRRERRPTKRKGQ